MISAITSLPLISVFGSFAGGTWDWEYLGFASPEVKADWLDCKLEQNAFVFLCTEWFSQ